MIVMKKFSLFLFVAVCSFIFAACGGGSDKKQTVEFQGITMDIPADWKAEKSTLSDDYARYGKSGKVDLHLEANGRYPHRAYHKTDR